MSEPIGASFVKTGAESAALDANNLYDRIINLKFTRRHGTSFCIRSDCEAVPISKGSTVVRFKPCTYKPDITISYDQVANGVGIKVFIKVRNLFIAEQGGAMADTADGDPITQCVIQMGYRSQFPSAEYWNSLQGGETLRFYDLNNHRLTPDADVRGGRQIVVQILASYPESFPPDRVVVFEGVIGSIDEGLRWEHTVEDLKQGYGYDSFPKGMTALQEALYQTITRRFVKSSVLHVTEVAPKFTNDEGMDEEAAHEYEQSVRIYGYNDYKASDGSAAAVAAVAEAVGAGKAVDTEWTELQLEKGLMSKEDADIFGVNCVVSKTLLNPSEEALYTYGFTGLAAEELKKVYRVRQTPFNSLKTGLGGQLTALHEEYGFLRWYVLSDGSFYFYHVRDREEDLWTDAHVKDTQEKSAVFLPGIYDMSPSGTRVIRCPFISFVSSTTTVVFQSRFMKGTLISFFYPPKTNAFLVITAKVEFATVEDKNSMELTCIDLPTHEVEIDTETGKVKVTPSGRKELAKLPEEEADTEKASTPWVERVRTVGRYLNKKPACSWVQLVHRYVWGGIRRDRWPADAVITEKMALEALKEWNPEYFDADGEYMSRGNSIENKKTGIGGRTKIRVPILAVGDKIKYRVPFQPDYPDDQGVKVEEQQP